MWLSYDSVFAIPSLPQKRAAELWMLRLLGATHHQHGSASEARVSKIVVTLHFLSKLKTRSNPYQVKNVFRRRLFHFVARRMH